MMYQALSLQQQARFHVHIVAHRESAARPELESNEHVTFWPLTPFPLRHLSRRFFALTAPLKLAMQSAQLLYLLLVSLPRCSIVLVQNPPAMPTLVVCALACKLRGARLVVDWHNFGYTILALSLHDAHPFVSLHRRYEQLAARFASLNFCVTSAMADTLRASPWQCENTVVLYDRPPSFFRRLDAADERTTFLRAMAASSPDLRPLLACVHGGGFSFTAGGRRAALVVSSTSWTPDEDFSVLFRAALLYERAAADPAQRLPSIVLLVTGKGPQRDHYVAEFSRLRSRLRHVHFVAAWLTIEDYPRILGAADAGVSLHRSSSGVDLPMKVVDMFGCHLPVAAMRYRCIDELVHDERNGLLFDDDAQLAAALCRMLRDFDSPSATSDAATPMATTAAGGAAASRTSPALESLRTGIFMRPWHDLWKEKALPAIEKLLEDDPSRAIEYQLKEF